MWLTQRDCYETLAEHLAPGLRTLEVGAGVSTVVFALAGTEHVAVFESEDEGACIVDYCRSRSIPVAGLSLIAGSSDDVLPRLPDDELDVVFIDGNHAYPFPQLDWFFAGGRLRQGGLLFVDDIQLPAVGQLVEFLEADPRWETVRKTTKWIAFRRAGSGPLREGHSKQPFLRRRTGRRPVVRRLRSAARAVLRPRP